MCGTNTRLNVDQYQFFLNGTQAYTGETRDIHLLIEEKAKILQDVQNMIPLDGTNIDWCIAAVGHNFRFPMDEELTTAPSFKQFN